MLTKVGFLIDFDLLKAVTLTNTKQEVGLAIVAAIFRIGYDVIFSQWVLRFGRNLVA